MRNISVIIFLIDLAQCQPTASDSLSGTKIPFPVRFYKRFLSINIEKVSTTAV